MAASLNPSISKFDEVFDAGKSSQYRLTIQFALDGLSYALLDTNNNHLIALEGYQSELLTDTNTLFRTLEQALEQKGLNDKAFQSVTCIVDERINTLVPSPLFDEANQRQYLDFTYQLSDRHAVLSEPLNTIGCYNVFAWSNNLKNKVLSKWEQAGITHSSSVFINGVMQKNEDHGVFVNVRNHDFDMAILKGGKLHFFNNFKYNTKEDFAYFLMFAMEQNGLSGQDTTVQFSGNILPSSEIIGLCSHYVKQLCFVEDPKVLQVSEALENVPFQYYFIHYQALR